MVNVTKPVLLALAGAALASQPASAFNLNLYGVGHLSIDNVNDGDDSSIYLASSSSRLGFNGEHGLDSGLSVIFQFETGLDPTAQGTNDGNGGADSSGQIFTKGRPSFVGLKGGFGQVLIGHMPALDQWANDYNLFADQVGDLGNLWEASGVPGRSDNVLQYTTPKMSGFDVAFTYVPEEGVDDTEDMIVKGNYICPEKKLKVGLAYGSIGHGVGLEEQKVIALTASIDLGQFTVGGGYQQETDTNGADGVDRNSYSLGASMKIGAKGTFKAQYATSTGDPDDTDATLIAIGFDYALDKHTTLYAAYARLDNDDNGTFSVNGKGHGDKVTQMFGGDDPNALSFGIVYKFDASLVK